MRGLLVCVGLAVFGVSGDRLAGDGAFRATHPLVAPENRKLNEQAHALAIVLTKTSNAVQKALSTASSTSSSAQAPAAPTKTFIAASERSWAGANGPAYPYMDHNNVEDGGVHTLTLSFKVKFGDWAVVNNTYMKPRLVNRPPTITYWPRLHYRLMRRAEVAGDRYTIMMINTVTKRYLPSNLHWLVVNIPGNNIAEGRVIKAWQSPHPYTGKPTYTFLLFRQTDGAIEVMDPEVSIALPQRRAHFDYLAFQKRFNLILVGKLSFLTQRPLFGQNLNCLPPCRPI